MTHTRPSVPDLQIVAVRGELDPPAVIALQQRTAVAAAVGRGVVAVVRAVTVPTPGGSRRASRARRDRAPVFSQ